MPILDLPILGLAKLRVRWEAREATSWLRATEIRLQDRTTFWKAVGGVMRESFRRNFAQGGRPAWQPLKRRTVAGKASFLSKKPSPPFSKKGVYPKRLLQNGQGGPQSILIRTGALRDSWVQQGARGHVEQVLAGGLKFLIGSALTLTRVLKPRKPVKHYHLLSRRSKERMAAGKAAPVRIPLARLHEEGTKWMPARRNAVVQGEDLVEIQKAGTLWVLGGPV